MTNILYDRIIRNRPAYVLRLVPIISGFMAIAVYDYVASMRVGFQFQFPIPVESVMDFQVSAREEFTRSLLMMANHARIVSWVGTIGMACLLIWLTFPKDAARHGVARWSILSFIISLLYVLAIRPLLKGTGFIGPPDTLAERLVQETTRRLAVTGAAINPLAYTVLNITAIVFSAAAMSRLISTPLHASEEDRAVEDAISTAKFAKTMLSCLRGMLYFVSFFLFAASLEMYLSVRWAGSVVNYNSDLIERLALSASFRRGVASSLILLFIYLPAILILRIRIDHLASIATETLNQSPESNEKWLKKNGLELSFKDLVTRITALITPLMAAPIVKVISKLF